MPTLAIVLTTNNKIELKDISEKDTKKFIKFLNNKGFNSNHISFDNVYINPNQIVFVEIFNKE